LDIDQLLQHYIRLERDEAIVNLRLAVSDALAAITAAPEVGKPFPPPYRRIARWKFRWIKVGRYWFAYVVPDGAEAVVMNVLFETSNIPRRVSRSQQGG